MKRADQPARSASAQRGEAERSRVRLRAFTLIEVMAAVFILGLFVAAISQLLQQASKNEGRARLDAQAAVLADTEIARLEEGLARGAPPPLGKSESGEGSWRITTEVAPFDATKLAGITPEAEGGRPAPPSAPGAEGSWLLSPRAKQTPPLLEIAVRVSWDGAPVDADTGQPAAIRRRTFALNPAALEALAEADAESGGEDGGANEGDVE
jgi:prepilin-type N-terminal cleavage/methylation domain-containing protein